MKEENGMSILGGMPNNKPIGQETPIRKMPYRIMFVCVGAASLLLMPALTEATATSAKPGHASRTVVVGTAAQTSSNTAPRVSPYAIANKQRAAESKGGHFSALQKPARRVNR